MDERAANDLIQRAAMLGDRARRTAIVVQRLTRLAVPFSAFACVTTGLAVALRGPRWLGPSLLAAAVALAGLALLRAHSRRVLGDRVAAELDRAAGLDGAFRSAWWFLATASSRPTDESPWLRFHISETARRVDGLDWRRVYALPLDRRRWLTACGFVLVMFAAVRWPARGGHPMERPFAPVATPAPSTTGLRAAAPIPALTDGIREIKAGRVPSQNSLAAVGRALDLARTDPAAKSRLDALFRDTAVDRPTGDSGGQPEDDPDYDERTQALVNPWALEWAYQDALSRASAARPSRRDGGPAPSARESVNQRPREDAREMVPGKSSVDGAAVLGQARGQAAGFSSLLFGHQQADGGDGTQKPVAREPAAPRAAALTMALRQEIVRASSDIADVSPTGARRAADNESSTSTGPLARPTVTYGRGPGSQPPAVPEDRRGLVHEFFARRADDGTPRRE